MSIVTRLKEGERCPYCGTAFVADMHPFAATLREEERKRRSKAAKKGWKSRRREESDPDRDGLRFR